MDDFQDICECGHIALDHHGRGGCLAVIAYDNPMPVCVCDHFTKLDEVLVTRAEIERRRADSLARRKKRDDENAAIRVANAVSLLRAYGYTVTEP